MKTIRRIRRWWVAYTLALLREREAVVNEDLKRCEQRLRQLDESITGGRP